MLPINQLLTRFKNLTNTDKVKKELIVEFFKTKHIPVTREQISFKKNTIYLKIPPLIKTEVMLHKYECLKQIKSLPGLGLVIDIQ